MLDSWLGFGIFNIFKNSSVLNVPIISWSCRLYDSLLYDISRTSKQIFSPNLYVYIIASGWGYD